MSKANSLLLTTGMEAQTFIPNSSKTMVQIFFQQIFCNLGAEKRGLRESIYMDNTEERFVERLRQKERKAYEELYDKYSAAIYGLGLKMMKSEALGQDAMQETFIKVWKKIHTYDPSKGRFFTWLLNIARNTCRDLLKKKEEKVAATAERNLEVLEMEAVQPKEIKEKQRNLRELVKTKLPPTQSEVIDLIYFGGHTHIEVAEILKMPLGTVKSNVRLAMLKLRKLMAGEDEG